MQTMLIKILFLWSLRHPASGYVQGVSDLAAPIMIVFLSEFTSNSQDNIYEISEKDVDELSTETLIKIEADVFWCLTKLVEDVQDNYIHN